MLKTIRDITKDGRLIPKGTKLVGAYNLPEGNLMTMVIVDGEMIKLVISEADTTMRNPRET